jgi:hypothetical protein
VCSVADWPSRAANRLEIRQENVGAREHAGNPGYSVQTDLDTAWADILRQQDPLDDVTKQDVEEWRDGECSLVTFYDRVVLNGTCTLRTASRDANYKASRQCEVKVYITIQDDFENVAYGTLLELFEHTLVAPSGHAGEGQTCKFGVVRLKHRQVADHISLLPMVRAHKLNEPFYDAMVVPLTSVFAYPVYFMPFTIKPSPEGPNVPVSEAVIDFGDRDHYFEHLWYKDSDMLNNKGPPL